MIIVNNYYDVIGLIMSPTSQKICWNSKAKYWDLLETESLTMGHPFTTQRDYIYMIRLKQALKV